MYEIFVVGPLCTPECAGECCFSANLCKRALDATADVIVKATRNAGMLITNASEDLQSNAQSNMNDYKTNSEEKQSDHILSVLNVTSMIFVKLPTGSPISQPAFCHG